MRKDIERPYRLRDIRKCHSTISDPVVARWIQKGFLSHGQLSRGTMPLYTFSAGEVVHAGVLSQLSSFGVLQGTGPMPVSLLGTSTLGKMTDPDKIIEQYERFDYDLCMEVLTNQVPVEGAMTRNKKAVNLYFTFIRSPIYFRKALDEWLIAIPGHYDLFLPGKLVIHVGFIAVDVAHYLGIEPLWKPKFPGFRDSPPRSPGMS